MAYYTTTTARGVLPTNNIFPADAVKYFPTIGDSVEMTPEQIADAGFILLPDPVPTEQPANTVLVANKTQEGAWTTEWMPVAEFETIQAQQAKTTTARMRRNTLLRQCDWTQGKDIPAEISTAWAPYRQALRDLTSQEGFPDNVAWPQPPQ